MKGNWVSYFYTPEELAVLVEDKETYFCYFHGMPAPNDLLHSTFRKIGTDIIYIVTVSSNTGEIRVQESTVTHHTTRYLSSVNETQISFYNSPAYNKVCRRQKIALALGK
ncbi:hypothetical protein D770_05380 [Flammeovirgaceae bacterium 311]|nr:hypothetical protein D770_05380 [Flammeovirgaceae bacterium 311]